MLDLAHASAANDQTMVKLILVVDDDEDIGLLIVQLIQRETSHAVMRHTSGTQALQAIQTHSPHLFILDYMLPDMNGLELHDQLHQLDRLKGIPTILISAHDPPWREIRKRKIIFLPKPFDLSTLLLAIAKHLG